MLLNRMMYHTFISLSGILVLQGLQSVIAQQRPPPNYSQDDMPITNFNCRDKILGGYYADPETECQMFHVCVKIPGVGLQDYRFLCPNDTIFDQEHQICDDWYNIDCELAAFYADSFDSYRIGVSNEIQKKPTASGKGTPIPLGPSSTIKPIIAQKPRRPAFAPVNNAVGDEDEDLYKRPTHGEEHAPNDILRGSSSGNFFSSKTKGREDLDDGEYRPQNDALKQQELSKNTIDEQKKQKTVVRKLNSKRPVNQQTNPSSAKYTEYKTVSYTPQNIQKTSHYQTSTTTVRGQTKSRGNINYNTYNQPISTDTPDLYQKINNLTESYDDDQTFRKQPYNANKQYNNVNSYRAGPQSNFDVYRQPAQKNTPTATTLVSPLGYQSTASFPNVNNFQQSPSVINNQLQPEHSKFELQNEISSSEPADYPESIYLQLSNGKKQTIKITTTSTASPNFYQLNDFLVPANVKYQPVQNVYQTSKQPAPTQSYAQPNTTAFDYYKYYQTSTVQPNTTIFDYFKYYQTSTPQPNTTVFDYYKYYQTSTAPNYQFVQQNARQSTTNNYYQTSTKSTVKYDPYAAFQKANSESTSQEELLKTEYSSNLKPSDLNSIYNQKKQSYINATLKAAYAFEQPKSSYNVNPAQKTYQPSTTTAKPTTRLRSTVQPQSIPTNPTNATSGVKKSNDYDYAYYDNGPVSSEYDVLEPAGEDFAKIKVFKN